ncbi:aldo/keto reductase [Pontibacter sp. G13]|uniref:potassium channel beta subunit family protein n=1 Tax=Pontibacter sp. G13 TaxID=3074898 RepID=UPI00288AD210|nr:aldo/keto reductase [Pontibacter sp. G13]WNJ19375.1 aldo/keto reductase [Pontibacter sp. G13]
MEYRYLGKSGLQVSTLSFGSWLTFGKQIGDNIAEDCMKLAYDNGVNFFDNAEVYSKGQSEIVMGEILNKMQWPRDTFLVSSKVFWGGDLPNQKGLSRKHIFDACHAALKRLQVDYLDMFFCHRPDYNTPVEETVFAMNHLIQQGKVLYWGTSEWPADRIMEAHLVARENNLIPPTMEQPQYNMLHRARVEIEYKDLYQRGLGTTIWSPLASGLLTGKYNDGIPEGKGTRFDIDGLEWLKDTVFEGDRLDKVRAIGALAGDIGISMVHLALGWCVKNPNVSTVILGASKVSQLEENLKLFDSMPKITQEVMDKVDEILGNKPSRPEF